MGPTAAARTHRRARHRGRRHRRSANRSSAGTTSRSRRRARPAPTSDHRRLTRNPQSAHSRRYASGFCTLYTKRMPRSPRAIALLESFVRLAALVLSVSAAVEAADAPPSVLLSRQLAARAGASVGDVVTLSAAADGSGGTKFRVAGVYEPTPDPLRFTAQRLEAHLHLPDLLALAADPSDPAALEAVSAINVKLVNPGDVDAFASALAARSPGVIVRQTSRIRDDDPFVVLDRFHAAISAVTVVGATAFLLALMVIRAEERRDTVAILRLIGISRRSLLTAVVIEGLLIAGIGAVFGVLVAVGTEGLINHLLQARYDTALVFVRVTIPIAVRSIAIALPLGLLAAVGASWPLMRGEILALFRR